MTNRRRIFNLKGHLTESTLTALKAELLSEDELVSAVTHMADCLVCAKTFADSFTESELREVPEGFSKAIEDKLTIKPIQGNKEFLFYSLRVVMAVCASIIMLFIGTFRFYANFETYAKIIKPPDLKFIYSINASLKEFSQNILNMEGLRNETKER